MSKQVEWRLHVNGKWHMLRSPNDNWAKCGVPLRKFVTLDSCYIEEGYWADDDNACKTCQKIAGKP